MDAMEALRTRLLAEIAAADTPVALDQVRVAALGRKGEITGLMKDLGGLDAEARKAAGQALNRLKDEIAAAIDAAQSHLNEAELERRLASERIDVTLPVAYETAGRIHPISQTIDELTAIFGAMGFHVEEGPHIEDDFYNFEALNIPADHPARQEHDTFYLADKPDGTRKVLRTHTSPVQIRTMLRDKDKLAQGQPIRIICPGRTFRFDHDATHSPMFHQVEGLVVDEKTHMGHLKGCLTEFLRAFFDIDDLPLRFRPSYFPFVEPGAEVDIGCLRSGGELKLGNYGEWLEILGCGMVHPKVLANCGIDPTRYQGFAFGMGIERIAMLKYGIPDLRTFYDSDLRWLKHYGFNPLERPSLTGGLSR